MGNRRALIRMTDEEVERFLREEKTLSVATHAPDGSIHLVAMWFGFMGRNVAFETFAKSQKVRNLERDPRITVMVEAGEEYSQLRGVEIVGRAVIHDNEEVLLPLARQVVSRYYPIEGDEQAELLARGLMRKRVAVEVVPDRVVSWDHRKLDVEY